MPHTRVNKGGSGVPHACVSIGSGDVTKSPQTRVNNGGSGVNKSVQSSSFRAGCSEPLVARFEPLVARFEPLGRYWFARRAVSFASRLAASKRKRDHTCVNNVISASPYSHSSAGLSHALQLTWAVEI